MRRIYLQKIEQYSYVSYVGKIDPRDLVRVATKVEMGEVQDAQRPLSKKRVKEIASYVNGGERILPSTLTIATVDNRYSISKCSEMDGMFYIEFPSEDDEYKRFEDSIFVMDGQHRLYSFRDDIRLISDNDKYEIGFCLYVNPTMDEKRRVFVSCNEKQEKVSTNLLMWFKDKLNLINGNEKLYYDLVTKLSVEYPLKGRIILGGEKITKGIRAKELMKVLEKNDIAHLRVGNKELSQAQIVSAICKYLSAWEKVVDFTFSNPINAEGAAVKIAGLRFMLALLPTFCDVAITQQKKFDDVFLKDTISKLIATFGVERKSFFVCDENKLRFRERSQTEMLAKQCSDIIKSFGNEDFDPFS